MKPRSFQLILIVAHSVFFLSGANGQPQPSQDSAQNAALQYWRAFQWAEIVPLPEGGHTNVFELIHEASQGIFSEQTEVFFERVQPYIERMRLGTRQPYCDWGTIPQAVSVIDLHHLSKGRSLVRLVSARFKHLVSLHREEEALALLQDAFQLTRHLDDGFLNIGIVIRNSAEVILIKSAAEELLRISSEALTDFHDWWERQNWRPPPNHLSKTFRREYLRTLSPYLEAAKTELSSKELEALSEAARNDFGFQGTFSDVADLRLFISKMETLIEQVVAALSTENLAVVQKNLEAIAEEEAEFSRVPETASNLANNARSFEIHTQMFRAALAMVLEGPGSLARYPAPYSGRPFVSEPQFRDHFRLKWMDEPHFKRQIRQITLEVGRLDSIQAATAAGDLEQVKYLLKSRLPVDSEGWTALHLAAQAGLQQTVEFLIKHEAMINALASDQVYMDPKLTERYGLKVREVKPGENLKTPLDLALEAGHENLAEYLRKQGARTAEELKNAEASPGD